MPPTLVSMPIISDTPADDSGTLRAARLPYGRLGVGSLGFRVRVVFGFATGASGFTDVHQGTAGPSAKNCGAAGSLVFAPWFQTLPLAVFRRNYLIDRIWPPVSSTDSAESAQNSPKLAEKRSKA